MRAWPRYGTRCEGQNWLQYELSAPGREHRPERYAALLAVVQDMRAAQQIDEFFFMHKPPGLRIRFRPAAGNRAAVDRLVRDRLVAWQRCGLVGRWHPAVYEPETYLFGGREAMHNVHRLFTADSMLWLAFHAAPAGPPGPSWALSLLMLRAVFDALQITGWEDLDVWDRLRRSTGRRLDRQATEVVDLEPLTVALRAGWSSPQRLVELLSPQLRDLLEDYRAAVAEAEQGWLRDHFQSGDAVIGARQATTYVIVLHWNRSRLTAARQALLAEALAAHPDRVRP